MEEGKMDEKRSRRSEHGGTMEEEKMDEKEGGKR